MNCLYIYIFTFFIGVTCSEVNVANAAKSPDKASYTYNEAVTYTCNPGYELTNGDSVRRCENMNTWSDSYPICTGTRRNVQNGDPHLFCLDLSAPH